jgi:D-arabinose 1-dehydrogenase-like Zn-dependent alcohol dehydrogenase
MRTAVFEEMNRPLVIQDVPDPKCPPAGAIIRVGANGICRTNRHLWMNDWAWKACLGLFDPRSSIERFNTINA